MRVAIYNGQKNIAMQELDDPIAPDGGIVVKNIYASICGTDVAVYEHGPNTGHRVTPGSEFGHEMVSQVVQVGAGVQGIEEGDIVYPYPLLAKGDPSRAGTVGAFSERILIPHAEIGREVYRVSDDIPLRTASLIEPFTVGCRAARRAQPSPGDKAIVFGAGTIGIAVAVALKEFGCDEVMVCDHSDFRLRIAAGLGFETCNNGREDVRARAMRTFGTAPSLSGDTADVNLYVDAAGAESILPTWQDMGKIGCRMVVVAVLAGMRPVDILSMTYAQHTLIGSGGYFPEDVLDVMRFMENGRWDIGSLITHEFPWEELPQAIEMAGNVDVALNVVVRY